MFYRTCTGLTLSIFLAACSQAETNIYTEQQSIDTTQAQVTAPKPTAKKSTTETVITPRVPSQSFADWKTDFKSYALTKGIDSNIFDQAFKGVTIDPDVVKADYSQPEFTRPVWEYLNGAVSSTRINNGLKKLQANEKTVEAIEQQYQVDREVMVAIWGMESGYGSFTGNKNVIRSLATLAYEGRRVKFAKEQLIAALQILQNGDVKTKDMQGSWAGAMGQTQFIPTTYLALAVDFDEDGHRNIWSSVPDALASTANYLAKSGWNFEETWGHEVKLPTNFNYSLTDVTTKKPASFWANAGVTLANGKAIPMGERSLQSAIILPAGARGPAFMVYRNFFAIMKYNNSTSYALAVSLLMDNFKGKSAKIIGSWPTDDQPLSRTERKELQSLLNDHGYSAGHADGIIGGNTRKAIRDYQQSINMPADGYPTHQLLKRLRGVN